MSGSEKDVSATRRPPGLLDLKAKAEKIRRNRAICRIRKPAALLLTALLAPDHATPRFRSLRARLTQRRLALPCPKEIGSARVHIAKPLF
jgi:hypothetical protein